MTILQTYPTEVINGQPEGKVGMKVLQELDRDPETPPSPEAKRIDVPRAPIAMYALQRRLRFYDFMSTAVIRNQ